MQSPKRAIVYGAAIWAVLILTSLVLRVYETGDSPLFESLKFIVLAGISVGCSVLYLQKLKKSSFKEGFLVGSLWLLITVALDFILYSLGLFNLSLASYFKDVVSSYFIMPVVSMLIMGFLRAKPTESKK